MKDSKQILNQLEQKIAQSHSSSTIEAGQRESLNSEQKEQLIDAINESFELLRINYQHLYFSAYKEIDALNAAKRLWFESLCQHPPKLIIKATHEVIKESDYLPTVSRMTKKCLQLQTQNQLPDAHAAYIEACNAGSPKENHPWSHPAVYYAGKQSNWFFLKSNEEFTAFPVFKNHYELLCNRILLGEVLPKIQQLALPEEINTPLSKEENASRMAKLRSDINI